MNENHYLSVYKASAGSGKTHILTQEYLKLAFHSPDNFRKILAVTFTNKAAEEMKKRILDELNVLIKHPESSDHRSEILKMYPQYQPAQLQRLALEIRNNILHNYSLFSVGTIDSFVQKVIRAFSFEIGIHSGYKIEMDTPMVIDELIEILFKTLGENAKLLAWLVIYAEHKINEGKKWDFREEIKGLAGEVFKEKFQSFHQLLTDKELVGKNLDIIHLYLMKEIRSFEGAMKEIGEKASQFIRDYKMDCDTLGNKFSHITTFLTKTIVDPPSHDKYIPNKTVSDAMEGIEKWYNKTEKANVIKSIEMGYPNLNECLMQVNLLLQKKYPSYLTARNILSNFHSFGILNDIHGLLPAYREDNNLLLISDTTLLLKEIVSTNDSPFIYEKIGNHFRHILIDEFQDTSGFQWENFKPLIKNSLSTGNYNLIVGDIKQSIYRWRGGDWNLLLRQVVQDIGQAYITEKSLDTNWRSRKNIIDFNNAIFRLAPVMLQNEFNEELNLIENHEKKMELRQNNFETILLDAYNDSYQHLSKTDKAGGRVKVHFIPVENRLQMAKKWREKIQELIPETIHSLICERHYSPKDITILVRKNREGRETVDLLIKYQQKHPESAQYDIISGESLYIIKSHSVRILTSALMYIQNQQDTIQLANLIYEMAILQRKVTEDVNKIFSSLSNPEKITEFISESFLNRIGELKKMSVFEITEELIQIFKLNTYHEELVYIRSFQDNVLNYTTGNTSDLTDFLEWWNDKGNTISVQLAETMEAVNIMTIHKSKGLGFKVVIIPYCDWHIDHDHLRTPIIWCESNTKPLNNFPFLPLRYKKELTETEYVGNYFEEKLYTFMDALNTLYVAFTRPKEELIIMSPTDGKHEKLSSVADVLYQSIKISNLTIKEQNKTFIPLWNYFDTSSLALEIQENGILKNEKQTELPAFNDSLILSSYTITNWREKLTIMHHASDFFIESIKAVEEKVNYGSMMHEILSKIMFPEDVEPALQSLYFTGKITTRQMNELKEKLTDIISRPDISNWFSPEWEIIIEKPLITAEGKMRIPDRILLSENETIVIDFKFGEHSDDYLLQVKEYMNLLIEIGYNGLKGFLYYPEENKKVVVGI
jgi:ATP-dependent exoDNAse (exonuclease V) beta subunit